MTQSSCNCTQFFMVRDQKSTICGAFHEKCVKQVENDFHVTKDSCSCLNLCDRIEYHMKLDVKKKYDWPKWVEKLKFKQDPSTDINFAVTKVLPQIHGKMKTAVGFFSLFGGLVWFFGGLSVMSGVELLFCFIFKQTLVLRVNPVTIEMMPEVKPEKRPIEMIQRYLKVSPIHGLKHIGNDRKSKLER
jgi:hypothetical protein